MRSTKLLSLTKRILGLDPVPVPPDVFALGTQRLRYGHFHRNGGGVELTSYRETEIGPEHFAAGPLGGQMHDPETVRALLGTLQESLEEPITEASIVLPDAWLRLAFVESDELPKGATARDEVLRWKLQRIVPFRVEDLRLQGVESAYEPTNGHNRRILIGFGIEGLLAQLEGVFADRGIHLGLITNNSLSCLSAARDALRDVELGAVVFVSKAGYSLVFALRGEPVLQRFKALPQLPEDELPAQLVTRDLKLTKVFLQEQVTEVALGRVLFVSPPQIESRWLDWLSEAFELPAHALKLEHFPVTVSTHQSTVHEIGPLFGVARMEVR